MGVREGRREGASLGRALLPLACAPCRCPRASFLLYGQALITNNAMLSWSFSTTGDGETQRTYAKHSGHAVLVTSSRAYEGSKTQKLQRGHKFGRRPVVLSLRTDHNLGRHTNHSST